MNQQELEALLQQIAPDSNPLRLTHTQSTDEAEVPDPDNPSAGAKKKVPVTVHTWIDRGTGMKLVVSVDPKTGTYTKVSQGVDPKEQGAPSVTPAQQQTAAGASTRKPVEGHPGISEVTTQKTQPDGSSATETHYEDASGATVPTPQAKPQVIPATVNTTSPRMGTVQPDGSITWVPNPNYQNPKPDQLTLPPTQKWVVFQTADGRTTTEKNPNYQPPSKIMQDPQDPSKWIEITEDDQGKPIIKPVTSQTTIKPHDLPVLQTKYGQIAQGLGQLASQLNGQVARGEITPKEREDAFTAAHKQAETQVAEINSILDNSRAIWSSQITQRGQSLTETQSRRSFASDAAGRALKLGFDIAESAGPGHGKVIGAGVAALLRMQQRYAEGMGGFRESPEVGLPPALEQARGITLPGFGPNAAPAAPSGPPGPPGAPAGPPGPGAPAGGAEVAAANAATQAQSRSAFGALGIPPASGITNTTDAGGVPRVFTPASSTGGGAADSRAPQGGSGLPPPRPPVAGMGAALGAGADYSGSPVAAGGMGMFDPNAAAQSMVGQPGSDPAWEEAVRQALAAHGQQQGGYAFDRFGQPSGRYGV